MPQAQSCVSSDHTGERTSALTPENQCLLLIGYKAIYRTVNHPTGLLLEVQLEKQTELWEVLLLSSRTGQCGSGRDEEKKDTELLEHCPRD